MVRDRIAVITHVYIPHVNSSMAMEEGIVVHEIVNVPEIVSLHFLILADIQALHRIQEQQEVRQSQARAAGDLSSLYPSH